LLRELEEVRRRGYSVSAAQEGSRSYGCALSGRNGPASAAISVSAPLERLNADTERDLVQALMSTCANLEELAGPL
ncbi:MAG TPA: IclR family transcriptional regulator C-terminal domain-containing protein, partial [Phenylobacterium sp.]